MKKRISLLLALLFVLTLGVAAAAEEDPVGFVSGNTYYNESLGVSMTLPESWRFLSDEEIADQMRYDGQYGSREGLTQLLEKQSSVCAMYATVADETAWNVSLIVQDLGMLRNLDEQTLFDLIQDGIAATLEAQGFSGIQMTKTAFQLTGQDRVGAKVTGKMGFIQMNMIVVLVKGDRYLGCLIVTSLTEDQAQQVLGFFEPLKPGAAPVVKPKASATPAPTAVPAPTASPTPKVNKTHESITAAIEREDWQTALSLLDKADGKTYPDYANVRKNCWNHVNYPIAKQAMEDKLYYTAYTLFSQMGKYQDAATLAAKCKRPTPTTGEMSRNQDYKRQTVRLNLNNKLKGGYSIYVRIYDSSGTTFVSSAFIAPGKGAVVYLPDQAYLMKAAYGKGQWYGELEMFGEDAIYKEVAAFSLKQVGRHGYYWYDFEDELVGNTTTLEEF